MLRTGLEKLACEVAISAPHRKSKYSHSTRIPWELVVAIRQLLTNQGYDWKVMIKKRIEIEDKRRQNS